MHVRVMGGGTEVAGIAGVAGGPLLRRPARLHRHSCRHSGGRRPCALRARLRVRAEAAEAAEAPPVDLMATATAFGFPALGGLAFGYDIGATSGALVSLTSATLSGTQWYELDSLASGFVVSGSLGGALVASALALVFGDKLGRRNELLLVRSLWR